MAKVRNGNTIKEIDQNLIDLYEVLGWEVVDPLIASNDEINLLTIKYRRVIGEEKIIINENNYMEYELIPVIVTEDTINNFDLESSYLLDPNSSIVYGNTYYSKQDPITGKGIIYEYILEEQTQEYQHILPNPSKMDITYSDVDREGSGRNENDGMMVRERIGHYQSIAVQWNIIPNEIKRRNLVKVLKSLPPSFTLIYYDNDNKQTKEMLAYHSDIQDSAFLFVKDNQIWQGLSTSFIQFDITPYDDGKDPTLENEGQVI